MQILQAPQIIRDDCGGSSRFLELPSAHSEVLPGIYWGRAEVLFTPAFWSATWWLKKDSHSVKRVGDQNSFRKEVVACLLGGYGISFELNRAAFLEIENSGIFEQTMPSPEVVITALSRPLLVKNRLIHYRFPRQKGRYVAYALQNLSFDPSNLTDLELRNRLTQLPGMGNKTASWIVRNWKGSDKVAIIDIHILRAGLIMGLFDPHHDPNRNYLEMENRFLEFAHRIGVPVSALDILMWENMRASNRLGIKAVKERFGRI